MIPYARGENWREVEGIARTRKKVEVNTTFSERYEWDLENPVVYDQRITSLSYY